MSLARYLPCALALTLAMPVMAADCGASVANLLLARQFDQAMGYFQTPAGALSEAKRADTQSNVQKAIELAGAHGPAKTAGTVPTGKLVKLSIGYSPKPDEVLHFRRALFAVDSTDIPGLLMSVHYAPDTQRCAVYTIALESYDAVGMKKVQSLLGQAMTTPPVTK